MELEDYSVINNEVDKNINTIIIENEENDILSIQNSEASVILKEISINNNNDNENTYDNNNEIN